MLFKTRNFPFILLSIFLCNFFIGIPELRAQIPPEEQIVTVEGEPYTWEVNQIPNPKLRGQKSFVSDPNHILSPSNVEYLDTISQLIDEESGAEFAIVVVNDYRGDSDFDFALELFNAWGIGKKGADNGLLLFIAKDRREYRFISGYGMERFLPDAYLKRIGEKYLVPYFKEGDYDQGLIEVSHVIRQVLTSEDSIKELESMMPEAIPFFSLKNPFFKSTLMVLGLFFLLYVYVHFVGNSLLPARAKKVSWIAPIFYGIGCMGFLMFVTLFLFAFVFENVEEVYQKKNLPYFAFILCGIILAMKITKSREALVKGYKDEFDLQKSLKKFMGFMFVPIVLSPLALIDLGMGIARVSKNSNRFKAPDDSGDWERMNRVSEAEQIRKQMDAGQKVEEKIGGRRYEVWKNRKSGKFTFIPWDIKKAYKECPQCHYHTLSVNLVNTIVAATYSSSGKGEYYDDCQNCSYHVTKDSFVIPKKVRSSSSSGGSGGGGSSGGGSSGGGSFGGGSSGGGGAGGRW